MIFTLEKYLLCAQTTKRYMGGMFPWEIYKIVLSKMQFPAFPGLELVNGESLLRHQKLLTKN